MRREKEKRPMNKLKRKGEIRGGDNGLNIRPTRECGLIPKKDEGEKNPQKRKGRKLRAYLYNQNRRGGSGGVSLPLNNKGRSESRKRSF